MAKYNLKVNLEIGMQVKRIRKSRRMTQQMLAYDCDMHKNQIGKIERGETGLNVQTLFNLADGLGTPPHELIRIPL